MKRLLIFFLFVCISGLAAAAEQSEPLPSYSLISPEFLMHFSALNSSVHIKIEEWERENVSALPENPGAIIFSDHEGPGPPERVFAWVKEGVAVVVWSRKAPGSRRYNLYRVGKDGIFAVLNAQPLKVSRYVDPFPAADEDINYYVEAVDSKGRVSRLSAPAAWIEPEVVPEVAE